jgi:hypothetical protein
MQVTVGYRRINTLIYQGPGGLQARCKMLLLLLLVQVSGWG